MKLTGFLTGMFNTPFFKHCKNNMLQNFFYSIHQQYTKWTAESSNFLRLMI